MFNGGTIWLLRSPWPCWSWTLRRGACVFFPREQAAEGANPLRVGIERSTGSVRIVKSHRSLVSVLAGIRKASSNHSFDSFLSRFTVLPALALSALVLTPVPGSSFCHLVANLKWGEGTSTCSRQHSQMAVGQKWVPQNGTLEKGTNDQNLRSLGAVGLAWTHTQVAFCFIEFCSRTTRSSPCLCLC